MIGGNFEPFDVVDNRVNDTMDFSTFNTDDIVEVSEPFEWRLGIWVLINENPKHTGFVFIPGQLENEENQIEAFRFVDRTFTAQEMKERTQL